MEVQEEGNVKRVMFVLGTLWGDNGITSHMNTLATGLMQHGWEIAIAANLASDSEEAKEEAMLAIERFNSQGVKFFIIPFSNLKLSPKNLASIFKSFSKLETVIRQYKPNIIHVHSLSICPYIYLMRLLHDIPYVSTCHLEPASDRLNVWWNKFANNYFNLILGDRVIAISSEIRIVFERVFKISPDKIRVIYHGIETEKFRPPQLSERLKAKEKLGLDAGSKVVCLIARLSSVVKGHDILIRSISILRSQGIETIALCAGKGYGKEEDVIRSQACEAGVSDLVRLLGVTDACQVLWASDVLVLPSRREGFALVIPEAMLCGIVPVRTPAAGALDQIENGVDGFIVPFDDPKTLASRLKLLFENQDLRLQMSATALTSARQKFSMNRMTKNTLAIYNELIDSK